VLGRGEVEGCLSPPQSCLCQVSLLNWVDGGGEDKVMRASTSGTELVPDHTQIHVCTSTEHTSPMRMTQVACTQA
jgi:hypothetical protein